MTEQISTSHTTTAQGTGALTVARLMQIAGDLQDSCPADATVQIATQDSQRDGSSWLVTVAWRTR